jgi:hypothetical protein
MKHKQISTLKVQLLGVLVEERLKGGGMTILRFDHRAYGNGT